MWTKCLPRDTIQPMESTLRNSNEIICKHRNLRLQVPGKVGAECGLIVLEECTCLNLVTSMLKANEYNTLSNRQINWKIIFNLPING